MIKMILITILSTMTASSSISKEEDTIEITQDPVEIDENESVESWQSYEDYEKEAIKGEDQSEVIRVEDIVEAKHDYKYASFGKKDPFIPPLLSKLLASLEIPITSPLQKFTIDQLSVVGIWILESRERKALVITPGDEGVTIKIGDPIGRQGGKVVRIDKSNITIRQFSLSPDGTRQFEDHIKYLGTKPKVDEKTILLKAENPGQAKASIERSSDGFLESTAIENRRKSAVLDKILEPEEEEEGDENPQPNNADLNQLNQRQQQLLLQERQKRVKQNLGPIQAPASKL